MSIYLTLCLLSSVLFLQRSRAHAAELAEDEDDNNNAPDNDDNAADDDDDDDNDMPLDFQVPEIEAANFRADVHMDNLLENMERNGE
jgi:hypothetical protein